MKVSVAAKDFKRMLKLAQSITDRYGIIEDRIAMSVHDGKFEIAALSFEGGAAFLYQWTNAGDVHNDDFEFVPAECGFCVVRHKGLAPLKDIDKGSDIVIEHKDEPSTGNVVTFTAPGLVFSVPQEDPGEWPEAMVMAGEPAESVEIVPDDCERFAYVLLAASTDISRPEFTGAVLRDGALVTTDSHRLHMRPLPALFGTGTFKGIIAPKLLRFIADGHAGKLTEFLDTATRREKGKDVFPTWHVLEGPDFVFKSKVIDGRFPDFSKVAPRYRDGEIGEVDAKTFVKTVKPLFAGWKCSLAIRLYNEQGGVKLVCTGKPNSKSPDQEPRLAFVKDLQLPNLPVAMNPAYVIDALTSSRGGRGVSGTVKFCAIDCDSPIWIGELDCGECTSGALIMPIQL